MNNAYCPTTETMANPVQRPAGDEINASAPYRPRDLHQTIKEFKDRANKIVAIIKLANKVAGLYNRIKRLIYL